MFPRLIKEDPEILEKLCEIGESNPEQVRLTLITQVAEYRVLKEFGQKPLHYTQEKMMELKKEYSSKLDTIKALVKEVIVDEGVEKIPVGEFNG